jgi:hypothetical protein
MRWSALFDDLEAQAEVLDRAARAAEIDDRTRLEAGALTLVDRLRPAQGTSVRLRCAAGFAVAGAVTRVGPDWVLVDEGNGREAVVALRAVLAVHGVGRLSAPPLAEGSVAARLGLRHVLRGLARDRAALMIGLADGSSIAATIDRVGADFVEAALHPVGEARRRDAVREIQLLAIDAVVTLRRDL